MLDFASKKNETRAQCNFYCPTYHWRPVLKNERNRKIHLAWQKKKCYKILSNGEKGPWMNLDAQLIFRRLWPLRFLSKKKAHSVRFAAAYENLVKMISNRRFARAVCIRAVPVLYVKVCDLSINGETSKIVAVGSNSRSFLTRSCSKSILS